MRVPLTCGVAVAVTVAGGVTEGDGGSGVKLGSAVWVGVSANVGVRVAVGRVPVGDGWVAVTVAVTVGGSGVSVMVGDATLVAVIAAVIVAVAVAGVGDSARICMSAMTSAALVVPSALTSTPAQESPPPKRAARTAVTSLWSTCPSQLASPRNSPA